MCSQRCYDLNRVPKQNEVAVWIIKKFLPAVCVLLAVSLAGCGPAVETGATPTVPPDVAGGRVYEFVPSLALLDEIIRSMEVVGR